MSFMMFTMHSFITRFECVTSQAIVLVICVSFLVYGRCYIFLPASPTAEAGRGFGSFLPFQQACHRNSSETNDPIFMKLGK